MRVALFACCANVVSTGAELVISSDTSCLLHLMRRARRRGSKLGFLHVPELLAEGVGLLENGRAVRGGGPARWP